MALRELPTDTIRLLGSSQVITSVYSVAKELVENSLDAKASSIELKLENFGLDKVEVRDNGVGISTVDVPFSARKYHTSKIKAFSDLENLTTYGFRGEALGSLCSVSNLSLTTKTTDDDISATYDFNFQGQITGSRHSHLGQGTTVTAINLFKNLPVRRQFYSTNKKKKEELKHIEDLLISYAVICPSVRFSLRHNKETVWQKIPVPDTRTALLGVLGKTVLDNLQYSRWTDDSKRIEIEMFVPRPDGDVSLISRSVNDRGFVFVNQRPVQHKEIDKEMKSACGHCGGGRYPIYVVSIVLPSSELDVNIEPNKTKVYLHQQDVVMETIRNALKQIYGDYSSKKENIKDNENCDTVKNDVNKETKQKLSKSLTDNSSLHTENPLNIHVTSLSSAAQDRVKVIAVDAESELDSSIPTIEVHTNPHHNNKDNVDTLMEPTITEVNCVTPDVSLSKMSKDGHLKNTKESAEASGDGHLHSTKESAEASGDGHFQNTKESAEASDGFERCEKLSSKESDLLCLDDMFDSEPPEVCFDVVGNSDLNERDDKSRNPVSPADKILNDSMSNILSPWNEVDSPPTCSNDKNCETMKDIPSGEQWSKGQGLTSTSGIPIQPVKLLSHGKRPLSPSGDSPPKKRTSFTPNEQSNKDDGELSSDLVCHGDTAFKLFTKQMTPKVIRQNPACTAEEVADVIKDAWDELPVSERTVLAMKAGALNINRSDSGPVKSVKRLKMNQQKNSGHGLSIKEQIMKSAKPNNATKNPAVVRNVDFSISTLKTTFSSGIRNSQSLPEDKVKLIGPIQSCGTWTCYHDCKIHLMNAHRIQETILYHKLMKEHVLPATVLEHPIKLTESLLGKQWNSFQKIANSNYSLSGTCNYLSDERFTSNGIKIRLYFDSNGSIDAELCALASFIPTYSVEDIQDILELISTTNAQTLYTARPLKVINYLKCLCYCPYEVVKLFLPSPIPLDEGYVLIGMHDVSLPKDQSIRFWEQSGQGHEKSEAVRMARQLPRQQDEDDIKELLIQIEEFLPRGCNSCLHDKRFYHTLYDLSDIPQTQYTQENDV